VKRSVCLKTPSPKKKTLQQGSDVSDVYKDSIEIDELETNSDDVGLAAMPSGKDKGKEKSVSQSAEDVGHTTI
jgi:hypothetical protein